MTVFGFLCIKMVFSLLAVSSAPSTSSIMPAGHSLCVQDNAWTGYADRSCKAMLPKKQSQCQRSSPSMILPQPWFG